MTGANGISEVINDCPKWHLRGNQLARLELPVGDRSFTSITWVFHYPYRAPNNLQKLSQMQEKYFEFSSKSEGRVGISTKIY